jgi:hypothetical protein
MPYLIQPASDLESAYADLRVGLLMKEADHAAG